VAQIDATLARWQAVLREPQPLSFSDTHARVGTCAQWWSQLLLRRQTQDDPDDPRPPVSRLLTLAGVEGVLDPWDVVWTAVHPAPVPRPLPLRTQSRPFPPDWVPPLRHRCCRALALLAQTAARLDRPPPVPPPPA
jgi:hypothetical protein